MGNIQTKNPEEVLKAIGETLGALGYTYDFDEENQVFSLSVVGKDIPMRLRIGVSEKQETIIIYSTLPIEVSKSQNETVSMAVAAINYKLINGCFEYDEEDCAIYFRMTESYRDSEISAEMIKYLIRCSLLTVDDYNDKLLLLCRGLLTLEEYEKEINFQ